MEAFRTVSRLCWLFCALSFSSFFAWRHSFFKIFEGCSWFVDARLWTIFIFLFSLVSAGRDTPLFEIGGRIAVTAKSPRRQVGKKIFLCLGSFMYCPCYLRFAKNMPGQRLRNKFAWSPWGAWTLFQTTSCFLYVLVKFAWSLRGACIQTIYPTLFQKTNLSPFLLLGAYGSSVHLFHEWV